MSDFTDDALGRYLDQQPGMREALFNDPVQRAQAEWMRGSLDMAERAMADEGIPHEARRRVINRIVWGEPEGYVDVRARVRDEVLAAYDLPVSLTGAWKAIHEEMPDVEGDAPPVDEYRLR